MKKRKMNEKEAIIILSYFNNWRTGSEIPMQKPEEITEAIKTVIELYKSRNK